MRRAPTIAVREKNIVGGTKCNVWIEFESREMGGPKWLGGFCRARYGSLGETELTKLARTPEEEESNTNLIDGEIESDLAGLLYLYGGNRRERPGTSRGKYG